MTEEEKKVHAGGDFVAKVLKVSTTPYNVHVWACLGGGVPLITHVSSGTRRKVHFHLMRRPHLADSRLLRKIRHSRHRHETRSLTSSQHVIYPHNDILQGHCRICCRRCGSFIRGNWGGLRHGRSRRNEYNNGREECSNGSDSYIASGWSGSYFATGHSGKSMLIHSCFY